MWPSFKNVCFSCWVITIVITLMVQNHRKSNFIRWLLGLTLCCLAVIASDIFPENRLLEFAAILIALPVFLLSFAFVFTNLRTALLGITAGAICFSVLVSHWPAKFRFSISRNDLNQLVDTCLLYTSPSPRDQRGSRMPSSA